MSRAAALAVLVAALAGRAGAAEKLGVIAVADPPSGPDADLGELTHQLRAACRDRAGGVEDVPTMRARLLGQTSSASLSELDRAYGGALAVYQNGEFESAIRTLRAIVEDLESIPESQEAYAQWQRALLRLAHAAGTIGVEHEVERAMTKLAMTDPTLRPDEDQFSPAFRRRLEAVKARVRALPKRKLTVLAEGAQGVVHVNGREMGQAPLSISLPAGKYRVGGAAGPLRVPSLVVDLEAEDRNVILDFSLAEAVRVNAGPGLALPAPQRAYGIIRAGAWLGVDKLIVASRMDDGGPQFLVGSIYDVRRGALLREGSVRMVAGGSVPAANLGALAAFLLTGQSSRGVEDRTRDVPRELREVRAPVAGLRPLPFPDADAALMAAVAPPPSPAERAPASAPAAAPAPAAAAVVLGEVTPAPLDPPGKARAPAQRAAEAGPRPSATPAPRREGVAAASAPAKARPTAAAAAPAPVTRAAPEAPQPSLRPSPPAFDPAPAPGRLGVEARDGGRGRGGWKRPAAIGSGVAALLLGGLAVQQGLAASDARDDARAMVLPNGAVSGDLGRYRALEDDADAASRNTYVSAGAAVVFAATAGVLGWQVFGPDRSPPALALHF